MALLPNPQSQLGSLELAATELERAIDAELIWNRDKKKEGEWRFAQLARCLALYERNQFWRLKGFASMTEFLETKADQFEVSRGTMFNAKWVGERLGPHLTDQEMKAIGKSKLCILAGTVPDGRRPRQEDIDLALSGIKIEAFAESIRNGRPILTTEDHADLDLVKIDPFIVTRSQRRTFEEMLAVARRVEGVTGRGEVFALMIQICHAHWIEEETRQLEESGVVVPNAAGDTEQL